MLLLQLIKKECFFVRFHTRNCEMRAALYVHSHTTLFFSSLPRKVALVALLKSTDEDTQPPGESETKLFKPQYSCRRRIEEDFSELEKLLEKKTSKSENLRLQLRFVRLEFIKLQKNLLVCAQRNRM
jgi:hypothetical protein